MEVTYFSSEEEWFAVSEVRLIKETLALTINATVGNRYTIVSKQALYGGNIK